PATSGSCRLSSRPALRPTATARGRSRGRNRSSRRTGSTRPANKTLETHARPQTARAAYEADATTKNVFRGTRWQIRTGPSAASMPVRLGQVAATRQVPIAGAKADLRGLERLAHAVDIHLFGRA